MCVCGSLPPVTSPRSPLLHTLRAHSFPRRHLPLTRAQPWICYPDPGFCFDFPFCRRRLRGDGTTATATPLASHAGSPVDDGVSVINGWTAEARRQHTANLTSHTEARLAQVRMSAQARFEAEHPLAALVGRGHHGAGRFTGGAHAARSGARGRGAAPADGHAPNTVVIGATGGSGAATGAPSGGGGGRALAMGDGSSRFGFTPSYDIFHHFVVTYHDGVVTVYLDGAVSNSRAMALSIDRPPTTGCKEADGTTISCAALSLGAFLVQGGTPMFDSGLQVAVLRFHEAALTANEVRYNFNADAARFGWDYVYPLQLSETTPFATVSPSRTQTPSQSGTRTNTPTQTATRTGTPTQTATRTSTPTPSGTRTSSPSQTASPSGTSTGTATPTATASATCPSAPAPPVRVARTGAPASAPHLLWHALDVTPGADAVFTATSSAAGTGREIVGVAVSLTADACGHLTGASAVVTALDEPLPGPASSAPDNVTYALSASGGAAGLAYFSGLMAAGGATSAAAWVSTGAVACRVSFTTEGSEGPAAPVRFAGYRSWSGKLVFRDANGVTWGSVLPPPARADACAPVAVAPLEEPAASAPNLSGWSACGGRLWAVGPPAGAPAGTPSQLWYTADEASSSVTALPAGAPSVAAGASAPLACVGGTKLLVASAAGPLAVVDTANPTSAPGSLGAGDAHDAGHLTHVPLFGTCWSARPTAAATTRTLFCAGTYAAADLASAPVASFESSVVTPPSAGTMAAHGGVLYFRCRSASAAADAPFYACSTRPAAPGGGGSTPPAVTIFDSAPAASVSSFPVVPSLGPGLPAVVLFHTAPSSGDAGGSLWAVEHRG